jgi:Brp/Blh family beta-carotene 15,15'-monooxygenase
MPKWLKDFCFIPSWLILVFFTILSLSGLKLNLNIQIFLVFLAGLIIGLPHGATDHFVPFELWRRKIDNQNMIFLFAAYIGLFGVYCLLWFISPIIETIGFILITLIHWGQTELYSLINFLKLPYLNSNFSKIIALVLRGSLPVFLPIIFHQSEAKSFFNSIGSLFKSNYSIQQNYFEKSILVISIIIIILTILHLSLSLFTTISQKLNPKLFFIDYGELLLMSIFFYFCPPLLAVGIYLFVWHSLRHIARLLILEGKTDNINKSIFRFYKKALPTTLLALVFLFCLYLWVPKTPQDFLSGFSLFFMFISALTFPHTIIVFVMDWKQKVWSNPNQHKQALL